MKGPHKASRRNKETRKGGEFAVMQKRRMKKNLQ